MESPELLTLAALQAQAASHGTDEFAELPSFHNHVAVLQTPLGKECLQQPLTKQCGKINSRTSSSTAGSVSIWALLRQAVGSRIGVATVILLLSLARKIICFCIFFECKYVHACMYVGALHVCRIRIEGCYTRVRSEICRSGVGTQSRTSKLYSLHGARDVHNYNHRGPVKGFKRQNHVVAPTASAACSTCS